MQTLERYIHTHKLGGHLPQIEQFQFLVVTANISMAEKSGLSQNLEIKDL